MRSPDARSTFALAVLLAVSGAGGPAVAATLHVAAGGIDADGCGTKTAPCRSLSRAIAAAGAGDKILVGPGRYGDLDADGALGEPGEESGGDALVTIDKPLVVESVEGAATTLIDAGNAALHAVEIDAAGARFGKAKKGFTVARAGLSGVLIAPGATDVTVSGVRAVRNQSGFGSKAARLVFRGDVAEANGDDGFSLTGNGSTIAGCRSTGNGGSGFAIGGSDNVLKANVASANAADGFVFSGDTHTLTGSVATGNATGLRVTSNNALTATGNSFLGNTNAGVAVTAPGITLTKSNVFGNGSIGGGNCGVATFGAGSVTLDQICFGAPGGPGDDPADAICANTGPIGVLGVTQKVIKVNPKVPL